MHGNLTLDDGANSFWVDPSVSRLVLISEIKAEPALNPKLNYDPDQPDVLNITMCNGEELEARCAYPLGAPQNPMSEDQLARKYQSITKHSAGKFSILLDWMFADDVAAFFTEVSET